MEANDDNNGLIDDEVLASYVREYLSQRKQRKRKAIYNWLQWLCVLVVVAVFLVAVWQCFGVTSLLGLGCGNGNGNNYEDSYEVVKYKLSFE